MRACHPERPTLDLPAGGSLELRGEEGGYSGGCIVSCDDHAIGEDRAGANFANSDRPRDQRSPGVAPSTTRRPLTG